MSGASGLDVVETGLGPVSVERRGRSEGPDLVLLHSLLSDRHVFDRIAPALGERFRLTLVDLPGFGSTPRVDPSIDAFADLVGALLDEGGYDPAATHLLGNGLGAFVALGTAVRHGAAFDRLVVVGCGHSFTDAGKAGFSAMVDKVEAGGMAAVAEVALRRIYTEDYLAAHPDEAEERRAVLLRTDPQAFVTACRALIGLDYAGEVADIRNRTCVVVGEDDAATPPAMAEELAGAIPGASLVRLPGLAHAPQLQDPDRFLSTVRDCLPSD